MFHRPEDAADRKRLSAKLSKPLAAVREILGKKSARAMPISALAAMRFASASRISGRRSRSSEGSPAGTAGGEALPLTSGREGSARDSLPAGCEADPPAAESVSQDRGSARRQFPRVLAPGADRAAKPNHVLPGCG